MLYNICRLTASYVREPYNVRDRIDRDSPVPIYHQIAEALRNAIAVGDLPAGARLPSLRDAGREWGVNLHTVRKAYGELAREGLVRVRAPHGTEVTGMAEESERSSPSLEAFLSSWSSAARERFGLSRVQLGQLLLKQATSRRPVVHVIECSAEQAAGHAREIMEAWRVEAKPLVLSEATELPPGVLVGTYFHYNDIRQRWPGRLEEVRFVAIAPDPDVARRLDPAAGASTSRRLLVCELDESKALNIAADLRNLFSEGRYVIEPRTLTSPARLPRPRPGDVLLVSPRVWGQLTPRQRSRVHQIRYRIRAADLERLGVELGWDRPKQEAIAS